MFDYTNNFPLPELKPEAGLLRLQAYTQTPEFQAVWQGRSQILDKGRMNDPTAWGTDTQKREAMTREEFYAANQLLSAEMGGNTGLYGEYIHEGLGVDVNQGAVLRSIYFGADPLNAMQFAPSELPQTSEEETYLADTLSKLLNDEIGKPVNQQNLTPTQKRIKEISDKLAYKKAMDRADERLGVSLSRQILAQSSWLSNTTDFIGLTSSDETGKLARNLDDIIRIRTRVDPTYSPTQWFNEKFSDPTVQQGLLDNGITPDFIADTTNSDEAEYRIYRALNQTDLQRRMATYSPEWGDTARLTASELVAGFINSPDVVIDAGEVIGGVVLTLGGLALSPFTGGTSLVGTVAGAAQTITGTTNLFLKLKNIWQGSKFLRGSYYAAETVLKLPMGFAPSYAKNLGLLGRVATPFAMGVGGGALTEYARQQNQMAYAAATLYADPDAVKDMNLGDVAMAGVQGGVAGGLMFGLAPNAISSLYGATKNKLLGVNYAKLGEPVLRDTGDRRFSFKGTVIGEAIDSFGNLKIKRQKSVAVDGPLQETMAAKAEITGKNPTGEEIVANTTERIDRVETKNVESPEKAESIPQTPELKRYENETRAGYVERIAGLKQVDNIIQFARELGRRSVTASDNLKLTTDNWDQMTTEDKLKVLIDADKQIKSLVSFEAKTEGGLTPERAKVISKMEVQRKALVKNLRKSLTKDQLKVFNKENKGGIALDTPTALKAVRAAKNAAAKREAASELAASLISKAQQIAKQPERAAEIRSTVPEELLNSFDEVTLEQNLKGTVSEETIEVVKANVAGLEAPKRGAIPNFRKTIKDALTISKIDNERMDKIRAVINNPNKFADIVTGNKQNAQNFYDYLSELKRNNLISETDMELVLAATAHLNFDSKAFNIKYMVDSLKNPDGSLIENVVGVYETENKTLIMNLAWKPALGVAQAQQKRAMTVLHELGHAYFQNQAKGNIYKEVLKLYKNAAGLNADAVFNEAIYNIDDKLIANDFLDSYHLSNAEETFVETFSKILFTEAEFAVASLRPIQVSMTQSILKRITESVVLASKMWDSSKHYAAASKIIDSITKVDALLDDGVSVPKFVRGLSEILPNVIDRNDFNTRLAARLGTNKYSITDLEFEMVNRVSTSDPAILVAFSILKTEGKELKTQKDFDSLIDAYGLYKAAQMSSLMVRTSFGIQVHTSRLMRTKTREERLAWFEDHFFNSYLERMGVDPKNKSGIKPPTYEDEYLLGLEVDGAAFPRETYGFNYWLTTGHSLLQFMDELGFDTTKGYAKSSITMSLLENLRQTYDNYDLSELGNGLALAAHRKFVASLNQTGLYNIEPIRWGNAEVAMGAISDMLTAKTDLTTVFTVLQSQVDLNIIKTLSDLFDRVGDTPEEIANNLLTAVYSGIEKKLYVINETTGKLEQAETPKKTKKPRAKKPKEVKAEVVKAPETTVELPEAPIKTPEESQIEAAAANSPEVTMDNYRNHLVKLAEEFDADRRKGITTTSAIKATAVINNLWLGKGNKLIAAIESGQINTVAKLRQAIMTSGKNIEKQELDKRKRKRVVNPVTGEVTYKRTAIESFETTKGIEKTGKMSSKVYDPVVIKGLEKQNKQEFISGIRDLVSEALPDFFTTKEIELLNALVSAKFDEAAAAKLLNISDRTVNRKYNELKTRVHALFKEADIDLEMDRAAIVTSLQEWDTSNKAAAKAATTKKPTPAAVKKTEAAKPAKVDAKAEEKGSRILEIAAKQAKLNTPNPDPVPVPKTTTEPTLTRTTAEVTGNAPEEVIRPETQADALAAGETNVVKESVVFTPKKPLTTEFANSTELEANPKKKQNLINMANRFGFDAIVFKDGSMLPLDKAKIEVVGKTEIDAPVGIETVVTVTKEKGVPVKKVSPKPKKPKGLGDGAPRTLTETGKPVEMKPEPAKSDIADETDAGRIERKMNEDRDALRASGLDTSSLKDFLSFYWNKMKEFDKGEGPPYTDMFRSAWNKFVILNDEINQANINLFGEEKIKLFWQKVDALRAAEAAKLATVPGYKRRTEAAILADAAKAIDENFIPYITPKQLEIKRVGENNYLSSKDKRIQAILRKNKEEPDVPTPPEPTPRPEGATPPTPAPKPETPDLKDRMGIIENGVMNSEEVASVPLRQSSVIGAVFGGSNRESANWWRRLMNFARSNLGQLQSQTGKTVQSLQKRVRFGSRLLDDTKAQTGHLAAAGKPAFRTALQCSNDEAMLIMRIGKYQSILNANLGRLPEARQQLMNIIWKKLSKGEDILPSDVAGLKNMPASMVNNVTRQANDLLTIVRQTNKVILDLEAETGLVKTVDEMGNPVDPMKWATVQLDHEKFGRLGPNERLDLIEALVEVRTNRKLASEVLDINTIIVMGWLDVRSSAKHQGTALLAGDRRFKPSVETGTFSRETLDILDTGIVHIVDTDPDSILAGLANKGEPDKFFVLEEAGTLKVYRLPEKISDLGEVDRQKYFQAIQGDTTMYHREWRSYLKGRNLIEFEMEQMLDFKTKRGYYSEYNSKTSSNIDRPLMKTGTDETVALAVPGLTPEEVLQNPTIVAVMRTNLAEGYYYFMKGRVFELLFQRELDRLLGSKGITMINILEWLNVTGKQDIETLGKNLGWSPAVIETRLQELADGVSRLREEYASHADTLPYLPNREQYAGRASMALMKMKVSPGYIISAMPELVLEMLKHNPIKIPGNIIKLLREVMGDLRFSKSAQLRQDGATLAYHMENFRHEHGSRFLGEVAHGSFELDNKVRTKFIDSTNPVGMFDRGTRGLEVGARVAESIGSLQAMTNFVRGLGLHRWQARVWTHFKKGRIQKLMDAMEDPAMKSLMNSMLVAAEQSPAEERKLWKQFAGKAREMGFGFEPQEAMLFFRYNLNSKEKIRHLEYLIRRVGNSNGHFNIDRMVDAYWTIRNKPVAGYDVKVFEEVISAYSYMLNDLVVRTTSPEPVGLARITNLEARTTLGRLFYALTSWIRGYQDSVLLNYASENSLTYIVKNLLLFGTIDSIIGLFREWLAGREQEDIMQEMEENPEAFAIRVLKAAPIMGTMNGILEGILSGINSYSGGTWRYYGSPMSSIGVNAASAAVNDLTTGVTDFTGAVTAEDVEAAKVAASIGKVIPFNSLFNRSAVAVPARFIEDMDYLDQKGAVQQYLDLIQREPYPYAKLQRQGAGRGAAGAGVIVLPPMARNLAKERAEIEKQEATRVKPSETLKGQIQTMVNDQKGVSAKLGELLQ